MDLNLARSSSQFVVWLTGLPAAGKTTIASILMEKLLSRGMKVELLDGDEIRKNLSPELGFSMLERKLHAHRVAYVSYLLSRNGIITVVALISPLRSFRENARNLINKYVEVWVKASLETCKKRDPKGLYKKAELGQISNLTGIQEAYESPTKPELIVDTDRETATQCAEKIIVFLKTVGYID